MNTSTYVLNAQRILAASSSVGMHKSWVPGMIGTLQECLGKNMRGLLAARGSGYPQRNLELCFQILGLPDRSYLSHIGSAGFPVVMGLPALFLTSCPILDLKKHLLMKIFLEMFQRKVLVWMNQLFLTIKFYWRIPDHPDLLYPDFHFAQWNHIGSAIVKASLAPDGCGTRFVLFYIIIWGNINGFECNVLFNFRHSLLFIANKLYIIIVCILLHQY